jgi:hypothetical protein
VDFSGYTYSSFLFTMYRISNSVVKCTPLMESDLYTWIIRVQWWSDLHFISNSKQCNEDTTLVNNINPDSTINLLRSRLQGMCISHYDVLIKAGYNPMHWRRRRRDRKRYVGMLWMPGNVRCHQTQCVWM